MPLLAIYRKPDSLSVARIHPPQGFLTSATLEKLSDQEYPRKTLLRESWESLGETDSLAAETLARVLVILIETIPESLDTSLHLPALPEPPAPRSATAANPRLNARKREEPKPPAFPTVDLRPYLCDPKQKNQLLSRLSEYWPEARALLIAWEYPEARLPAELPASDPYLWFHLGLTGDDALPNFPEQFRRILWPLLRDQSGQRTAEWLGVYWALDLEHDRRLCRMAACLLAHQPEDRALAWVRLLAGLLPGQRASLLQELIAEPSNDWDPRFLSPEAIPYLRGIGPFGKFVDSLQLLLKGVKIKADPAYVWGGLQLAELLDEKRVRLPPRSGYCPFPVLEYLYERLESVACRRESLLMDLWEACGRCDGFGELLESHPWKQYDDHNLLRMLWLCQGHSIVYEPNSAAQENWRWLREHLDTVSGALQKVDPDYQEKYFALVSACLNDGAYRTLPQLLPTILRLSSEPFDTGGHGCPLLCLPALRNDEALLGILCAAPSSSFHAYEGERFANTSGVLIDEGLQTMLAAADHWTLRCFHHVPRPLLRVARLAGTLPVSLRHATVREFTGHLMMGPSLASLPQAEVVAYLSEICREPISNPVPRKLKLYYEGQATLREGQLRRAWDLLRANLLVSQIDLLEQIVLQALRQNFDVDPNEENVRHALQMSYLVDSNRKAFRRFLRAHWEGRERYLEEHPVNAAWLASRKNIPLDLWRAGITVQRTVAPYGTLKLQVEQNPLEALKLGTYVGSCLSLGGINAHSAVAVVLDVNKLVVYARSESGTVVARQLIALSEENELVCFDVYPVSSPESIRDVFRIYDQRFAGSLGIKLCRPRLGGSYTIANLVSQHWYDDGAADFGKAKRITALR